jgi:ketose-bisphosphate aldolase
MNSLGNNDCIKNAREAGLAIPAFNVPYLPLMEPVVRALRDTGAFGFLEVARLEWTKFQARSLRAVYDEFQRVKDERYVRLHLDHVPVVDEDGQRVDYEVIIQEAIQLGYQSVMVDGSRLPFAENIAATKRVADLAHAAGIPAEGELGAVLGHEAGPLPPYEELFASGRGFTDPEEARWFVQETGIDWLSVAVGNVHGAISGAARQAEKLHARLNLAHLERIREVTGIPLVLHGGSGIEKDCVLGAIRHGIAKINVATAIRQPYEAASRESAVAGQKAAYEATVRVLTEELELADSAWRVNPGDYSQ